jgi:hypothetical protein
MCQMHSQLPHNFSECLLENIGKPVFHRWSSDHFGGWMQVNTSCQAVLTKFGTSQNFRTYPKAAQMFGVFLNFIAYFTFRTFNKIWTKRTLMQFNKDVLKNEEKAITKDLIQFSLWSIQWKELLTFFNVIYITFW